MWQRRADAGGRILFYMIHSSDHPQAPIQMGRAYRNVVQPLETEEQLRMEFAKVSGSNPSGVER